jgi:hypothetical protein
VIFGSENATAASSSWRATTEESAFFNQLQSRAIHNPKINEYNEQRKLAVC